MQHTPESNNKSISNDIVKEPIKPPATTTEPLPNGCPKTTPPTCTTSLLDSAENLPNGERTGFPTSGWLQFWILLKRTIWITLRDKMLTRMRLVSHFIVGILIGLIYYDIGNDAAKLQSNVGCIFFTTMFTMFTAMMPTILTCKRNMIIIRETWQLIFNSITVPLEMSIFVREHLNYWYSLKAYYFAKTLADIPFQVSWYLSFVFYWFLKFHFLDCPNGLLCYGGVLPNVTTARNY